MATWGEFIAEFQVVRVKPSVMYVPVEQVITLWEERNRLRQEVAHLRQDLSVEREGCAQEVDDLAEACAGESDQAEYIVNALRAAAGLIRERDAAETEAEPEIPAAEEPPVGPPPA
ncbi:MAG: hypothetical protein K2R98_31115 [Gemmataceae bacterium]|nr:hypothetical protein [Gemmataceae bacterium]